MIRLFLLFYLLAPGLAEPSHAEAQPWRVLFLGNSITLHSPAPNIGWTGHWGMAASAEEKDYVHLLTANLARCLGSRPQIKVRNIADFERGYSTYDAPSALMEERKFSPTHVILAIGENVPDLATEEAQKAFSTATERLINALKAQGGPVIFMRSCFWPHPIKDRILREVSGRCGAVFVDISPLGSIPENAARTERKIDHPGVAGHPGDHGMRALADALFAAIRRQDAGLVLIRGESPTELAPHGLGNVYAPEIAFDGTRWRLWYGGQGRDGHDRIHLAESADGITWTKRGVSIDCGSANHVNDPSVVHVGNLWWMFYTVAQSGMEDQIAAAVSPDGRTWEQRGTVFPRSPSPAWDSGKVGRPSILFEDGTFRLWYDAQPSPEAAAANPLAASIRAEGRAVGYAESKDGLTWTRRPEPVLRGGAGAVHVSRQKDRLIMLSESSAGIRWAVSQNGLEWTPRDSLTHLSGTPADHFGQVTPFLIRLGDRDWIFFGAAARKTWDGNAVCVLPIDLPP